MKREWYSGDIINLKLIKFDTDTICYHNWDSDPYEISCMKCGLIRDFQIYTIDKNCTFEPWPRQYVRTAYYTNLFGKICGIDLFPLSDYHRELLVRDIPNPGDWYQVYQKFKEWDLQDIWTSWNILCDNPKRIDLDKVHWKLLVYVDEYWKPNEEENDFDEFGETLNIIKYEKRNKKKLNVFYMLYKIVEMTGYDTSWVPLKLRSICIEKLDEEWKAICKKFNWKFIKTNTILQKIYWNESNKKK